MLYPVSELWRAKPSPSVSLSLASPSFFLSSFLFPPFFSLLLPPLYIEPFIPAYLSSYSSICLPLCTHVFICLRIYLSAMPHTRRTGEAPHAACQRPERSSTVTCPHTPRHLRSSPTLRPRLSCPVSCLLQSPTMQAPASTRHHAL